MAKEAGLKRKYTTITIPTPLFNKLKGKIKVVSSVLGAIKI